MSLTLSTLVPLLQSLTSDQEAVIRQHLTSQLVPIAIVCMVRGVGARQKLSVQQLLSDPTTPRMFVEAGYKVVTSAIVSHLQALLADVDIDVRRGASEAITQLATQIQKKDVATVLVPLPVMLCQKPTKLPNLQQQQMQQQPQQNPDGFAEELRITACHLLAELAGASENGKLPPTCVSHHIWPAVELLCRDPSFRVRRCAAQALPRVMGGCGSLGLAENLLLPTFQKLSNDEMYRVRKSTGECLVDMSRSLLLVAAAHETERERIQAIRRTTLMTIAGKLLSDPNKFVRHGMMQFLGPFIASFYPLGALQLPGSDNTEKPFLEGIGSQFFPHASSMVSRLNSSGTVLVSSPTPTPATLDPPNQALSEHQKLLNCLPEFIVNNRISWLTLRAIAHHRRNNPPDFEDVKVIQTTLLKQFCDLATISTGDENTDAEMRVYCAYSYPAVVLLFGPEYWEGPLKQCFFSLINPNHNASPEDVTLPPPPLPVKRCLASSIHTIAHILGPTNTVLDVLPIYRQHFFIDGDDSVRLNVIRNFPAIFMLLPKIQLRKEYLGLWKDLVRGEDLLGAYKRSATNPMLLNWRQRGHISQSLPDLIGLADSRQLHEFVWPIMKMLLVDTVSSVQEDAEWSVPLLLRSFCSDNAKEWSADVCREVISWLKETILGSSKRGEGGGTRYSKRQVYCRICSTVGLALQFGDGTRPPWDEQYRRLMSVAPTEPPLYVAYQSLSLTERKYLRRLLVYDLLPPALDMKSDRVTNVRLSLMKMLQLMPPDIRSLPNVSEVLQELEEEWETWESFLGGETVQKRPSPPPAPPQQQQYRNGPHEENRADV
jgi:hypothetical protein